MEFFILMVFIFIFFNISFLVYHYSNNFYFSTDINHKYISEHVKLLKEYNAKLSIHEMTYLLGTRPSKFQISCEYALVQRQGMIIIN